MSEDKDLLSRISQLAGRINIHKGRRAPSDESTHFEAHHHQDASKGYGYSRSAIRYRGRAFKSRYASRHINHRNRSLVLSTGARPSAAPSAAQRAPESHDGNGEPDNAGTASASEYPANWVSKRDRHMQLINASIYDKDTSLRNQAIEQTRQQKLAERDVIERRKISTFLNSTTATEVGSSAISAHTLNISGITFRVRDDGSKLLRIKDDNALSLLTPKTTIVGGVKFFRSKNGNLYRAALARSARTRPAAKITKPCKRFSTTGQCSRGPLCAYTHDPEKVAICREYLRTGECSRGGQCDLSHVPSYERVPACLHFLRGSCAKPDCRYAHVRVNPAAGICRTFASFGYCPSGVQCTDRHIFECPDYSKSGCCRKTDCRLPHIDRAGQLRHTAAFLADGEQQEGNDDVSSDDDTVLEENEDDIDSDGLEEQILSRATGPSENVLSSQDFVRL